MKSTTLRDDWARLLDSRCEEQQPTGRTCDFERNRYDNLLGA